jgi:hypothetical protein
LNGGRALSLARRKALRLGGDFSRLARTTLGLGPGHALRGFLRFALRESVTASKSGSFRGAIVSEDVAQEVGGISLWSDQVGDGASEG